MSKLVIFCLVALLSFCYGKVRFDGYRVVTVPEISFEAIDKLQYLNVDVWAFHPTSNGGISIDVMINDDSESILKTMGLTFTVKIPSVQANIDREEEEIKQWNSQPHIEDDAWYAAYHNFTEITTYTRDLAAAFPNLATFVPSIGKSVENRDIPAIIINSGASTVNRYFHIIGGQHAREWVAPATTLYVAEQLIRLYSTDSSVKAILDRIAFYIVPVANPDGYVYTWANSGNRLWRKNRRANSGGSFGVDLNRNWDDGHWAGGGSSSSPTSDTYHGTAAFSEPEAKALGAWISAQPVKFTAALDFHSYSQLILRPAGWTNTPTANETVLSAVGTGIRSAILAVNNIAYTSQRSYQLYQTTGTSTDYWYYKSNIVYSYCIELRDTGNYGFQLPANQILPTGRENFAGLKYWANYLISNS